MQNNTLFGPQKPQRLSRTKIEEFVQCPRCFYLGYKLKVRKPSFPSFTLNSAVDYLLKREFDIYRKEQRPHPLMESYGIKAVPFSHEKIDKWRNSGVVFWHRETNFEVLGKVDDLWVDKEGNLIVVDYKSTSTSQEITLEGMYKEMIKREVEVYQWIFKNLGFQVSDTAFFVYVNAIKERSSFDGRLEFDKQIIPYKGDISWIEPTLFEIREILNSDKVPDPSPTCEFCEYVRRAKEYY